MEHKDTKDIEKIVDKKFEVARGEEEIKNAAINHDDFMKKIDEGYDLINGSYISDAYKKQEKRIEFIKNYLNNYQELQEHQVDIENEIDDEEEIVIRKKERKPKKRSFMPQIITGTLALLIVAGGVYVGLKKRKDLINKGIVEGKTATYEKELDSIIDTNTAYRIGNLTYINGKEYVLDEQYTATEAGSYVTTNPIASYIENTDNPDLAAFVLYEKYGKSDNPTYNGITNQTFSHFKFDGMEKSTDYAFKEYIEVNGYSDYDEYEEACLEELINDDDSILDNIKVKIKKMAK